MPFGFFGDTGFAGTGTPSTGLAASRALDSESRLGRQKLFSRYLANSPGYGGMSNQAQYIADRQKQS